MRWSSSISTPAAAVAAMGMGDVSGGSPVLDRVPVARTMPSVSDEARGQAISARSAAGAGDRGHATAPRGALLRTDASARAPGWRPSYCRRPSDESHRRARSELLIGARGDLREGDAAPSLDGLRRRPLYRARVGQGRRLVHGALRPRRLASELAICSIAIRRRCSSSIRTNRLRAGVHARRAA